MRSLVVLFSLLTSPLLAQPASPQLGIGMRLEDAGFKMKEANTPQKMQRLKSIPAHTMVPHRKNGTRYYVYADPTYCKCAYIGDEAAMKAYRNMPSLLQPDNVGRSTTTVVSEMENEMADESGTNFDDIFHPGF